MTKVIGYRVDDDIYNKIKRIGIPSIILRRLILEYLSELNVNRSDNGVNRVCDND